MFMKVDSKGDLEFVEYSPTDPSVTVDVKMKKSVYGFYPSGGKIRAIKNLVYYSRNSNRDMIIPNVVLESNGALIRFLNLNGRPQEIGFSAEISIETEDGSLDTITINELFGVNVNANVNIGDTSTGTIIQSFQTINSSQVDQNGQNNQNTLPCS